MPILVSQLTMLMLILILVAFPALLFNQVFLFLQLLFILWLNKDGCIVFLTYIQWFFITDLGWRRGVFFKKIRYRNAFRYSRTCICIPYLHMHCLHRRSRFKKSGGLENIGGQWPKKICFRKDKSFIKILLSTKTNVISLMYNCKTFWILKTRKYF